MEKNKTTALVLCIVLGYLGVHRFYVGKNKSGILYLCTAGLCGIGWIVDIVLICTNKFNMSVATSAKKSFSRKEWEKLGIDWYIWRTSEDERVRPSHKNLNGVLVNVKDPPDPEKLVGAKSCGKYHAGDIDGCRCYPEPIVELKYVKFPAKVYYKGKIQTMTREDFKKRLQNKKPCQLK